MNNGGCSVNKMVKWINNKGYSVCGKCNNGYKGDGKVCNLLGVCEVKNGGCKKMERWLDKNSISK